MSTFGFQTTARLASNEAAGQAGSFVNTTSSTQILCDDGAVRPASGCRPGFTVEFIQQARASGTNTFVFQWTPPPTAAGAIRVYVAGLAGNGNGTAAGDRTYTASYTLQPSTGAAPFPGGYRFTPFDVPGAEQVYPKGLNDLGVVTGYYAGADRVRHGFIRDANGAVTTVDVPGAAATLLGGINNSGQIAGFTEDAAGAAAPFLRQPDGTRIVRTVPGATRLTVNGINTAGQLAGAYDSHGILFAPDGSYNIFDVPFQNPSPTRGVTTTAEAVNDFGEVAGYMSFGILGGAAPGCYFRNAALEYTALACATNNVGLNNAALIAVGGRLEDRAGNKLPLGYPGAAMYEPSWVNASAINNANQIAGHYLADGRNPRGFVASPCPVAVSPLSRSHGAGAESGTIQVTAASGCIWATDSYTQPRSGAGNATLTYTLPSNDSSSPKTTVINVAGSLFIATQAGAACTITLGTPSVSPSAAGGSNGVSLTAPAGCPWSASTTTPWITLTEASGTGSGSLRFVVAPNATASSRNGEIIVNGQTFYVNQAAGPFCGYTLRNSFANVPFEGAAGVLPITSPGCPLTVSSDVTWIAASVSGGDVLYTVAANATRSYRQGTLTIGGLSFQINQDSGTNPVRVLSVSPVAGSGSGQAFSFQFAEDTGQYVLQRMQMLIGPTLMPDSGCLVYYDRAAATFSLMADNGRQWQGPVAAGAAAALANSRCTLDAARSGAVKSGNIVSVSVSLAFAQTLAGTQNIWAEAAYSGFSTLYYQLGRYTVTQTPVLPAGIGVTPAAGEGTGETFRFTFNPATPLVRAQILINSAMRPDAACLIYFNRSAGTLLLMNNPGTSYTGPGALGAAGVLENNQCVIDLARSSATAAGNGVALDLAIAFRSSFVGMRQIFAEMLDTAGVSTGYQAAGSYRVVSTWRAPVVSFMPDNFAFGAAHFRFEFQAGVFEPVRTQMLIGPSLSGGGVCLIYFDRGSNTLQLLNDAGTAWMGPSPLGSGGSLANSQCVVEPARSSSSFANGLLAVEVAIGFRPSFAGPRRVFAEQFPVAQATSGYFDLGSYTVGGGNPLAATVAPDNGAGGGGVFQFAFDDIAGFVDIVRTQVLFGPGLAPAGSCLAYYSRAENTVALLDDAGGSWSAPRALGAAGVLENSQCVVSPAASSAAGSGTRLTLNLAVAFKSGFRGVKQIYAEMFSAGFNLSSGYSRVGAYNVTLP